MSEGGIEAPYNVRVGRKLKVIVETLINQVYLSPFSGRWFEKTFKKLVKRIRPKLTNRIVVSEVKER